MSGTDDHATPTITPPPETIHRIGTRLGTVVVREVGTGQPALLWHSMFVDSRTWDRVIPALSAHRRLLIVDGPGFGASDPLPRRSSIAECARVAEQVLDHFDVPSVDWVGNAWGGHVGIALGASNPGRLRSLISIGAPTHRLGGSERTQIVALRPVVRVLGFRTFVRRLIAAGLLSERTRADDPDAVAIATGGLGALPKRSFDLAVRSFILDRPDLSAEAGSLDMPVLFAAGDDRGEWTPEQAGSVVRRMDRASVATLPGVRGIAPLEDPAATTSLITDFWAGL